MEKYFDFIFSTILDFTKENPEHSYLLYLTVLIPILFLIKNFAPPIEAIIEFFNSKLKYLSNSADDPLFSNCMRVVNKNEYRVMHCIKLTKVRNRQLLYILVKTIEKQSGLIPPDYFQYYQSYLKLENGRVTFYGKWLLWIDNFFWALGCLGFASLSLFFTILFICNATNEVGFFQFMVSIVTICFYYYVTVYLFKKIITFKKIKEIKTILELQ